MSAAELPDWLPPLTEPPEDPWEPTAPTPIRPQNTPMHHDRTEAPATATGQAWDGTPVPLGTDRPGSVCTASGSVRPAPNLRLGWMFDAA
jgi:replicative DNA helicase